MREEQLQAVRLAMNYTFGLAFDNSGHLYVGDLFNGDIYKYSPDGSSSSLFATGFNAPAGLAFDSAQNLLVAKYSNNTISSITPEGVVSVFADTGLTGPNSF